MEKLIGFLRKKVDKKPSLNLPGVGQKWSVFKALSMPMAGFNY